NVVGTKPELQTLWPTFEAIHAGFGPRIPSQESVPAGHRKLGMAARVAFVARRLDDDASCLLTGFGERSASELDVGRSVVGSGVHAVGDVHDHRQAKTGRGAIDQVQCVDMTR